MALLIITPTTTVHVLPAVSATMADASVVVTGGSLTIHGVSYKQVQNSFGKDVYNPFDIYMQSTNLAQLTTPMQFFIFDADGNKMLSPLTPTVDPYQTNSSIYFEPKKNQVVFNGNSGLNFNILPLTSIMFQFICTRTSNQALGHAANFRTLERIQNVPSFFLEYDEDLTKKAPLVLSTRVRNNTNATQTIDLFSSPYDLMANVNNHTEYKWDITGLTYPATIAIALQYRVVSALAFSLYNTHSNGNVPSILAALNALGVSFFYTYTELGVDYIATYSDSYVFGDLTLDTGGSGTTTTTTTSTTTQPPTTTTTTTTSTTTVVVPPSTTTTTTTTSTTTNAVLNINYIATSAGIALACTTSTAVGATPNTGNFCTATQLIGAALAALPIDTYYFSFGGNYLTGTTNGTSIATITGGGCLACPVPTTTTTTTSTTTAAVIPTTTTTTTSTTTQPPTTTTTTTTSTTTAPLITVSLYAKVDSAPLQNRVLWYSLNNWATATQVSGTIITTTGQLVGTINIPSGSTLSVAIGNAVSITDGSTAVSGKVSTPNDYNALPLACGGSVSTTQFTNFNYNIFGNAGSFDLACSVP